MKDWLQRLTVALYVTTGAIAATANHAYQFNSVAVTGGGYITGIVGHPTEKNLLYARTDIGSTYRWNQEANKWIPLTDFLGPEDENLMGTESVAMDPTNPDRLYLAQGRYLNSNQTAFFVSDDRGASFKRHEAPFPMGANELGRNNGERLAVNPFKTNEIWFGTRNAGLMKSGDRAKTWTNVTSFPDAAANGIGITFVIFDPDNEGTIYVGACVPGGLYVSKDSGKSWDPLPGQPKEWDESLLIYPNETQPQSTAPQPMKAVLASNGALYVTYADAPGPWGVAYGAVHVYNTTSSKWSDITPTGKNTSPAPYTPQAFPAGGYCGLSVAADDPDTVVVVSLDRDPGPALDSMYLSRDGGRSWKDVSQLSTPSGSGGYWGHPIEEAALKNGTTVDWLSFNWGPHWGGYGAPSPVKGLTKFGWWMTAVLIDPSDPDHVMYATGATIWSTDNISQADKDAAPAWYIQAQGIEETVTLAMISPPSGPANLITGLGDINGIRHDDLDTPQSMLSLPVFSNLNTLDWAGKKPEVIVRGGPCGHQYEDGCGQAAYSKNEGTDWVKFATCIPGVNTSSTNPGVMAIDASGKYVVWTSAMSVVSPTLQSPNVPATDSGPYASLDWGKTWKSPRGLTVQTPYLSADRVQPKTFYAFTDSVWYVSTDGGVSYKARKAKDVGLPVHDGAVPVVNYARAGEIWLALGREGVYHTTNFGRRWKRVSSRGTVAELITVGAGAKKKQPALFIRGRPGNARKTEHGIYRSDDGGATWDRVDDESHRYGGFNLIQGDPRVYGRVYLGTGGRGTLYADIARGRSPKKGNVPGTGGI
ncbi:putative oligoxyloglucan-reducing end-specific xyloglucanase [Aspergillus steynii IBT 23096]|uniref:Putative oligoxyloglucan-reducing end-specific xyloglucanase n=1 Tax=Aspergillus steynii IBT 23096 TaxID=1392250 RepID=A0A2I2GD98_9EURO|nr:putative oligoxyloglucan-reducing end-specific xyloglucanase [Aspergillus steynii IBT 23096]PLB50865.1 putative oligoxyloglucan-reducing end-specific xyloglucanase [Aspergillus steynii IBT 23096]